MDLSRTSPSLFLFLLQWKDRSPASYLSGFELKNWSHEITSFLSRQVLQEIAPLDEIICRHPCEYDCNLQVREHKNKFFLSCPSQSVKAEEIAEQDIKQYQLNLPALISTISQINKLTTSSSKSLFTGMHYLGNKIIKTEKVAFCLAVGLLQSDFLIRLRSLKLLLTENKIIVFFVSEFITDDSIIFRLNSESIYPMNLAKTMTADTLKFDWNKIDRVCRTGAKTESTAILAIDTKKRKMIFKGEAASLQPKPFMLIEILAERVGEVVSRNEIHDLLWPEAVKNDDPAYDGQIDKHKRKIIEGLLTLCKRNNGITQKEVKELIITHSKIGLQLDLKPDQIDIL